MAEGKDLLQVLWSGADVLRGKMDANEYKTYLLGLVFYKYLSDSYLSKVYDLLNDETPNDLEEAQDEYESAMNSDDANDLLEELQESLRYTLDPDMTYVSMLRDVKNNSFNREKLQAAFNRIQESDEIFNGLFADVDLYSNRLGTGDQKQSATVAEVIRVLDGADLIHTKGDILGNAYEYLIGQFASETGKKAGEFYTPHGPAQILCRIAMTGQEDKKGLQVYDPCMGSGSLMLSCRNYSSEPEYIKYYGQELMPSTYNLARMKEVDKDSPEYQTSSDKFRKQTDNGYAYYIVEDIGEEYEESGNSQSEGIQIVKFSKQLEKESLYQERHVYNEMVKNMYEGLTLRITVTYGDGTTEIVNVGFKAVDDSDGSGKVSDKVAVYVK